MKKILTLMLLSLFLLNTNAQERTAKIEFESTVIDYGTIEKGSDGVRVFKFTNTGNAPLIVSKVKSSCGCTVPQYPKNTPIAPGASGKIMVSFDSSNKPGMQQKSVTLSANTASGREMLRIKSNVTPDPVKQQQRDAQAKARQ